ncbi:PREDICTED: CASP-like protein 2B2 [Camelina sativa]|uniref:CASP-like protein n=1 Tax=Camelina sativa TaxID=90675 RepID=A0ABM0YS44_CAMSA|nr:PREDICTED: CASP-like protein 2B2 [Camelina sativa]
MKLIDRKVRVAELILRCSVFALALLAAILIVTDVQVKEIFMIKKEAKFTNMKALVFMVVVNGIAAGYSLLQAVRCVVGLMKGNVLLSKPLAWTIFSGDQVVAYLCVAGTAAAAQSAAFAKLGVPELQWMKVCDMYGKFCNQVGEGIASSLFACVGMVLVSCISAFGVFRLYGGSKTRQSSRW